MIQILTKKRDKIAVPNDIRHTIIGRAWIFSDADRVPMGNHYGPHPALKRLNARDIPGEAKGLSDR